LKQTEKTEKKPKKTENPKFSEKIAKYPPYQTVSVEPSVCFGSIKTSKLSVLV
jgi:hypothetical protein